MGTEQSVHRSRTVPLCDESMSLRLRNNYHPLQFHYVHGENIKISKQRTVACRSEGFCNGIVFSDRPIMICEPVYVKFLETSPNWSGALRIGFTMNDPVTLKSKLPRYACPDLTSMHGNWAKAVGEKYAKKDSILYYYVDQNGDVHYGIGSEEHGIFFGGVNTSGKLWAVLDIYGNTVAVEFMDPNSLNQEMQQNDQSNLALNPKDRFGCRQSAKLKFLAFHSIHGKNVTLKKSRSVVSRRAGLHSLAYAFTQHPVEINRPVLLLVLETDHYCEGHFVYGITSCNPEDIDPHELPVNVDDLYDRSEYWIVKEKSYSFKVGDVISFLINSQGQVEVAVNGEQDPVFYVDHSQPLWLFVNLTHSISELRIASEAPRNVDADVELLEQFHDLKVSAAAGPSASGQQSPNECVICCEEGVNCALYRCGHMCMCYDCACKLWKSSSPHCPICRDCILDVIKIYK